MILRDIVKASDPVKVGPDSKASDALIAMMENKTDFVLVDRTGPDDAYGLLTRWDIVQKAVAEGRDLQQVPVIELARKPLVVTNNLELDLRWVAKKMAEENVSKLAVFDKENFLGFVSDVDIIRAAIGKTPSAEVSE